MACINLGRYRFYFDRPTHLLNSYSFQEDNATCWFKNPNHDIRLHWLIGSQSFWLLLIGTGETFCSLVVLWYLRKRKVCLSLQYGNGSLTDDK